MRTVGHTAPDLAGELADVTRGRQAPAWPGRETLWGHGVINLPFSSGHHLGLRVFPRTPFSGYVSVWHRDPTGRWSQHVHGAPVHEGCPRYWGPALARAAPATIDVTWTGPAALRVTMDDPELTWDLAIEESWPLAVVNAVHRRLPTATWRPRWLVALRERAARWLGTGAIALSGPLPTEEHMIAALDRLYWVGAATAHLDGVDLGRPVVLPTCPTIGGWPLPRRGVYAVGAAHATVSAGPSRRSRRRPGGGRARAGARAGR